MDPQGPRTYTKPLAQESALEVVNLLVGSSGNDCKPAKSSVSHIVPSWTPPPHIWMGVTSPRPIPKAPPLTT